MPKKKDPAPGQLTFESLLDEASRHPGKLIKLPFDPRSFGGELLAILSHGLYTNPFDCIREYCQNSIDANCSEITLKITGNSVFVHDDGDGMSLEQLVQARLFGVSPKRISQFVGFRGIGIYSGFDLCQRLRITTTSRGDTKGYTMIFEFAAMKSKLAQDRKSSDTASKTPLMELLSENTSFGVTTTTYPADAHFTTVELQSIEDFHIDYLSDRNAMRRYLLQSLPIDFDKAFEHRDEINSALRESIPGYHAVTVTLQSDGLPDETVTKEAILGLRSPIFRAIRTDKGTRVAFLWACLNQSRGKIDKDNKAPNSIEDPSDSAGLVYKIKGFTIGGRQKLRGMFARKPQLYIWYTGEVYVLDDNVVPNAERNDFETNQAKTQLEIALLRQMEELETHAEDIQAKGVADERVDRYVAELENIENAISSVGHVDPFTTYSRLSEILVDLNRQKQKASPGPKDVAAKLVARVKRLQTELRKESENPTPADKKRTTSTKQRGAAKGVKPGSTEKDIPLKTIAQILTESNWDMDSPCRGLVDIIEPSVREVLTPGSSIYRQFVNDFEARILAQTEGDSE